jgi:hypothetical protein
MIVIIALLPVIAVSAKRQPFTLYVRRGVPPSKSKHCHGGDLIAAMQQHST